MCTFFISGACAHLGLYVASLIVRRLSFCLIQMLNCRQHHRHVVLPEDIQQELTRHSASLQKPMTSLDVSVQYSQQSRRDSQLEAQSGTNGFEHLRYGSISISTYPTGQIGFFVSHAHDGDDEFVCKTHTGMGTSTSTNTCQENSHNSISSLADDKMDMSVWMDWHQIWASYRELRGSTKHYHPRIHRR